MSELGNKQIMAKNIKRYLSIHNISQKDICDRLKIKESTFSDWVNAKTYPRIDKIELLANYFGIVKSDLVEENKEVSVYSYEDALKTIADYNGIDVDIESMSEDEKKEFIEYTSELLELALMRHNKKREK